MSVRTTRRISSEGEHGIMLSWVAGNRWEPGELWDPHRGRRGRPAAWFHRTVLRHDVSRTVTTPLTLWNGTVLRERTLLGCSCGKVWVRRK
jgi:hypothetical protein